MEDLRSHFERNNRYRYVFENGSVYRVSGEVNPKPTSGEDLPGP
jgi:hypothetical protein